MSRSTALKSILGLAAVAGVAFLIFQALDDECEVAGNRALDLGSNARTPIMPKQNIDALKRREILAEQLKNSDTSDYTVTIYYGPGENECTTYKKGAAPTDCKNTQPLDAIHATQSVDFNNVCSKEDLMTSLGLVQVFDFKETPPQPSPTPAELTGLKGEKEWQLQRLLQRKSSGEYRVILNLNVSGKECLQLNGVTLGHPTQCTDRQGIHATQHIEFTDQAERREFIQAVGLDPEKYGH
jgi:hypothetical protein